MAKYHYDEVDECFKREINRGVPLRVNITEALRIINMLEMGETVYAIKRKVKLCHPKGTDKTVESFIKNYKEGNIEIPTDAPLPSIVFDELVEETKLDELEKRIERLEDKVVSLMNEADKSVWDKVKRWKI